MSAYIPVFTSPERESEIMSAYQAIMDKWPVPYKELTVSTSFGETHVIASGPEKAPPVVLLHALLATATSWFGMSKHQVNPIKSMPFMSLERGIKAVRSNRSQRWMISCNGLQN